MPRGPYSYIFHPSDGPYPMFGNEIQTWEKSEVPTPKGKSIAGLRKSEVEGMARWAAREMWGSEARWAEVARVLWRGVEVERERRGD